MTKNDVKKVSLKIGDTTFYKFDKDVGFWGIPNLERYVSSPLRNGEYIRVYHNSEGNRDKEFVKNRSDGTILCIGGSNTWGGAIEQDLRYSNQLEKKTGVQVVNVGHCSLGLDQICLKLMKYLKYYNPSVVIIEQYPWAIHRVLSNYVNGYVKPYFYLGTDQDLKLHKLSWIVRIKFFRKVLGAFYLYRKELQEYKAGINLKDGYDSSSDPIFSYWKMHYYKYMYNLIDKILVVIRDLCHQHDTKLIFALGTVAQKLNSQSISSLIDYDLPRNRLIELFQKNGIKYVDMTKSMLAEHSQEDPVIFYDGHINVKGHSIFTRVLHYELKKQGWLNA